MLLFFEFLTCSCWLIFKKSQCVLVIRSTNLSGQCPMSSISCVTKASMWHHTLHASHCRQFWPQPSCLPSGCCWLWAMHVSLVQLHVEHISCVIMNCGQHQWVIPSPLNSSLSLTGGNIIRKLLFLFLNLFFKILLIQVTFLIFFSITNSLSFLLIFFKLVCYCSMWLYFSQGIVNSDRVAISSDKSTQWVPSIFCSFLIPFYPSAPRAGGVLSSRSGRAAAKLAEPISL